MKKILAYIFLGSLAFDLKGGVGDSNTLQVFLTALTLISGLWIFSLKKDFKINAISVLIILDLFSTLVPVMYYGIDFEIYLKNLIPFILFTVGYLASSNINKILKFDDYIKIVFNITLVSIIYTFIVNFFGRDLIEIRYEILNQSIYIIFPIICFNILIKRNNELKYIFSCLFIIIIIILSATRSWLLSITITLLFSIITSILTKKIKFIIVVKYLCLLFIFIAMTLLGTNIFDHFIERLFVYQNYGFDATSLTRLAEVSYQLDAWLSNLFPFLFGRGVGSSYGFSGQAQDILISKFGYIDNFTIVDWNFVGHNFWIYSMYSQGILFGWIMPYLLMSACLRNLKNYNSSKNLNYIQLFLILISIIDSTIGGNPFGVRLYSLLIGLLVGLSFLNAKIE